MYTDLKLYVDGEWLECAGRGTEEVVNPATGKSIGTLPHATSVDLDRALQSAQDAAKTWKMVSAFDRGTILRRAANLIRDRIDHMAHIMTIEQGKSLTESKGELMFTADTIDWFAEEGRRAYGRVVPSRMPGLRQIVVQEPVGVVAAFTPWNFPTLTPARKIGGALAAGCTLILKAAEETPGSAIELVRCFVDAGLPKGVLNLVFGVPAMVSEHLVMSEIVKKISLTGSASVGRHLAKLAAAGLKRTTLELGGHAPVIVFDDADPEKAADMMAAFKFRNAGQVCIAPSRFFVQENNYERFVNRFVEAADKIKVGNGLHEDVNMGPLANSRRLDAMEAFVTDALDRGGRVVTGGRRIGNEGYFFQPTVLTGVPDDSRIMTEEPFGPLAPIVSFKSFEEVIERANSVSYGLSSYAFTNSHQIAQQLQSELAAGLVGINTTAVSNSETPFGGIKESGYGVEGGIEGLQAYMNIKTIAQA